MSLSKYFKEGRNVVLASSSGSLAKPYHRQEALTRTF